MSFDNQNDSDSFDLDAEAIFERELQLENKKSKKAKYVIKDEVRLNVKKLPKALLKVEDLAPNKLGRVIEVINEDLVLVDFWDTKPAKVYLSPKFLKLDTPASEVAKRSADYVEEVVEVNNEVKTINDMISMGKVKINPTLKVGLEIPNSTYVAPLKADTGKERVDLINPDFILEIGRVLGYGANKYPNGDYNYLEGQGLEYSRVYSSLNRHILKWYSGEQLDPETGIHHLIHAAANLQFLFNYDTMGKGIDNRRFKK
jgi:hypothetical protein